MRISQQTSLADFSDEYAAFVEKFKPKKTTDDCYTPDNVYKAVLDWVVKEYGIDPDNVKRPFWPGANYLEDEYPDRCCVVDNPPFSILSKICKNYMTAGIKFFLFAPLLTNFTTIGTTHIITNCSIMYENGAEVNTAFLTNLDDRYEIRTALDLQKAIMEADKQNRAIGKKTVPKYSYPDEVLTATDVGYMSAHNTEFFVPWGETFFIRKLDAQAEKGKEIFGGGFLLSEAMTAERAAAERAAAERAAAERAAAEKWTLSERERDRANDRKGEKMRDLTELNKLENYLKERGIQYERRDVDDDFDVKGHIIRCEIHQIIVPKDGLKREWDVICHRGSYGAEEGLLEIYGKIVRPCGDSVEGYLTAEDVIDRIEEVYGKEEKHEEGQG